MLFEGNQVELIELNGEVYFNPYHVGNCLGISESSVRSSMSKMTAKQVVKLTNVTVQDMDSRKLHHNGENFLTESGVYKLAFRSNKPEAEKFTDWVADEVLPSIRKTGSYSAKPLSQTEFLLETAKAMVELDRRIHKTEKDLNVLESRLNSFDNLELENKRQKLTAMVSKFAYTAGVSHQYAWKSFKNYFNNAYNTNIGLLITHFKRMHKIEKKVTVPEYLETVERLDDAIRIADEMIQTAKEETMVNV